MDLYKKKILIVGAAGFLGSEFSKEVLSQGAKGIFLDINKKKLLDLKKKLNSKNYFNFDIIKIDVTNEKEIKKVSKKIKLRHQFIDGLINLVSIDPKISKSLKNNLEKFSNFDLKKWNFSLNVGLTGTVLSCKYFINLMNFKSSGSVINVSSDLSVISPNHNLYSNKKNSFSKPIVYSAVKHGIIGITKYLSTYYANSNIRVNSLSPGGVYNNQPNNFIKKINKLIPMGRMAKVSDYNGIITYLLSDKSKYMTGSNIVIDGGRSII